MSRVLVESGPAGAVAPAPGDAPTRVTRPRPAAVPGRDVRRSRPAARPPRNRTRLWWGLGLLGGFAVLLGAVALQVMLIGGQRELDAVRSDIEDARVTLNGLRRDESQLRSPADIRDLATERLGMVTSDLPALVPSPPRTVGLPAGDPRGAATPTSLLPPATGTGSSQQGSTG